MDDLQIPPIRLRKNLVPPNRLLQATSASGIQAAPAIESPTASGHFFLTNFLRVASSSFLNPGIRILEKRPKNPGPKTAIGFGEKNDGWFRIETESTP